MKTKMQAKDTLSHPKNGCLSERCLNLFFHKENTERISYSFKRTESILNQKCSRT
jgi:hypothetical protein